MGRNETHSTYICTTLMVRQHHYSLHFLFDVDFPLSLGRKYKILLVRRCFLCSARKTNPPSILITSTILRQEERETLLDFLVARLAVTYNVAELVAGVKMWLRVGRLVWRVPHSWYISTFLQPPQPMKSIYVYIFSAR